LFDLLSYFVLVCDRKEDIINCMRGFEEVQ